LRLSLKVLGPVGVVLVALFLAGVVTGPLGATFTGGEPFMPSPDVHLPAEPVFPHREHLNAVSLSGDNWAITNTMLASSITLALLIGFFYTATRRLKVVPGRLQALAETIVEMLLSFVEAAVGKERARAIFPMVATIFMVVLLNAWLGILPLYAAIGFIADGKWLLYPFSWEGHMTGTLLRNANTDLNQPLAIALASGIAVEYWGMRHIGTLRYLGQFFNFRNLLKGRPMGILDIFIGMLEILSHFIRILSFTFRLFGNMTAGEVLLLIAAFLVPFMLAVPFYGLELLIGFVQALIFAGLTLAFATIAMTPHEEEHG
jgi:F-type H+-transporting ATPase subunit a